MPMPRNCRRWPILIAVALLATGCGSSKAPGSDAHAQSGGAAKSLATTAEHQLLGLRSQLRRATAKLPTPSTASTIERAYLTAVAADAQRVWRREFKASQLTYRAARVVLFSRKVKSDCGEHEDSGPFYCPADHTVYLDVQFFTDLLEHAGVSSAAQAYIVGHEFGHHVQQLLGIAATVADANETDPGGKNARSVKVELQADCLAGVWGSSAFQRTELTTADLNEALKAAEVIGDDYIQKAAGDVVDSAQWTHGSSQQRQYWARRGYESGRPSACNTFAGG